MKSLLSKLFDSPWRLCIAVLVPLCVVSACGGGVDSGGTGAPAQSFSAGRIEGFGSVIVNGVHFDDSRASIVDDDAVAHARGDLKLGMVVDIDAGPISVDADGTARAVANRIQFGSAIEGPVQAVDAAKSMLTVLDQPVHVDAATVFAGIASGVAGVQVGNLLRVHALLDTATGTYTATRIELASSLPAYRLRGVVSQLDNSTHTFVIGGATISFLGVAAPQLPNLVDGAVVRLKLQTVQQAGVWLLANGAPAAGPIPDRVDAELEGIVSHFTSLADFQVDGTTVDASGAGVVFRHGSSGQVANGVHIEVEGTMSNGVLVARAVEIRQAETDNAGVELRGDIESVNAAQHSFVLRGNTVVYDNSTQFMRGTAANLVVGATVQVDGQVAHNGTDVLATSVKFGK